MKEETHGERARGLKRRGEEGCKREKVAGDRARWRIRARRESNERETETRRCNEEETRRGYRLIDSRGFVFVSLSPLLLFSASRFPFVPPPECERVRVCLCAFEKHVSEVTQTE